MQGCFQQSKPALLPAPTAIPRVVAPPRRVNFPGHHPPLALLAPAGPTRRRLISICRAGLEGWSARPLRG